MCSSDLGARTLGLAKTVARSHGLPLERGAFGLMKALARAGVRLPWRGAVAVRLAPCRLRGALRCIAGCGRGTLAGDLEHVQAIAQEALDVAEQRSLLAVAEGDGAPLRAGAAGAARAARAGDRKSVV